MKSNQDAALVPNVALALDHAELWPDPEMCPDWPLYPNENSARMNRAPSRADAEKRLRALEEHLNRGALSRVPTKAERSDMQARFFVAGVAPNWRWPILGITHLRHARPTIEEQADMIVEAAHIRGFLHKLTERDARNAAAIVASEEAATKSRASEASKALASLESELCGLADAEARHHQRVADEEAARKAQELRYQIRMLKRDIEILARNNGADRHVGSTEARTQLAEG